MSFVKDVYNKVTGNQALMRVFHTFWQAAIGVVLAGVLAVHSTSDVKALVAIALTTGLAAVKNAYVYRKN